MSAGFRTPLPTGSLGNAGTIPAETVPGFRGPFAFIYGLAGAVGVPTTAGFREPFAFVFGLAGAGTAVVPSQPGAGGGGGPSLRSRRPADWIRRISRDDEEVIMLIPELWTVIEHED